MKKYNFNLIIFLFYFIFNSASASAFSITDISNNKYVLPNYTCESRFQNDAFSRIVSVQSIDSIYEKNRNSDQVRPRIFAVIVGISDYTGSEIDLNYSDNDARLFYKHLQSAMPNEMRDGKSILLLNGDATYENILNSMRDVFSQSNQNDFIVFYFSGHGGVGNFLPYNYNENQITHKIIKEEFKKAKGKYRLCIADACYCETRHIT